MIRQCIQCGKEFENLGRQLYCSQECRAKAHEAVCPVCGKTFVKRGGSYTCSRECGAQYLRKNRICAICGQAFRGSNNNVKYCSEACNLAALVKQKEAFLRRLRKLEEDRPQKALCKYCGKEYIHNGTPYCSEDCEDRASRTPEPPKKKRYTLDHVVRYAAARGLSYGKAIREIEMEMKK